MILSPLPKVHSLQSVVMQKLASISESMTYALCCDIRRLRYIIPSLIHNWSEENGRNNNWTRKNTILRRDRANSRFCSLARGGLKVLRDIANLSREAVKEKPRRKNRAFKNSAMMQQILLQELSFPSFMFWFHMFFQLLVFGQARFNEERYLGKTI